MDDSLWVFGYGSLIWDPGFRPAEVRLARLHGWQRRFCMWSVHYRGTADAPGLVLALDAADGAFCDGVASRVDPGEAEATLAALRARELISAAYVERRLPVDLAGGGRVEAVTYTINLDHAQYCGNLTPEEQAVIIARSAGVRGPNRDYLNATVAHLAELGIADAALAALASRVREIGDASGPKPL